MPDPFATLEPVLTAEAMREADRRTIDDLGLPGFTLMETAGRAAADAIERVFGPMAGRRVACYCGKGNNGGDGFVVARVLHTRGASVRVVALSDPGEMSDEAARNGQILEHLADDRLALARFESLSQIAAFRPADLHVDALLGTGLTSELREPLAGLVDWLNEQTQPTVALDVPTGLHSDHGAVLGTAIEAALTVTMGAYKAGLLLGEGPQRAGRVEVAEIGIPRFVLAEQVAAHEGCAWRPTDATVAAWLPRRAADAHKYSAGMALVVAGQRGMTGAAAMAATAAARSGAGYVTCACPETAQPTLAAKLTEIPTLALPTGPGGGLDSGGARHVLAERLEKARALLVGPGMGRHPATQQFLLDLLEHTELPTVVDADGLNALAAAPHVLARHAQGRWILTPHAGEFRRLADDGADLADRIRTATHYARRWNAVLVLKGSPSIAAGPDGTAFVDPTGSPALATAGTGDVLAGLCTGLLAQGLAPLRAAVCALYLGGAAAARYAETRHAPSMLASDLLDQLPPVITERFSPPPSF